MRRLTAVLFLVVGTVFAADDFKPEDGFTMLFNGKNFDGWVDDKKGPLDGKVDAYGGRFKAVDGVIVIDPAVKGDKKIFTAKSFSKDVTIRFQFKPGEKCNNDLFIMGTKYDLKVDDAALKKGEWNDFEIAVKGGQAEFKCNGKDMKPQKTKTESGDFAIRAEFGAIEIRRLRIKN